MRLFYGKAVDVNPGSCIPARVLPAACENSVFLGADPILTALLQRIIILS